jgi:undecaprenyl-diphosphatase
MSIVILILAVVEGLTEFIPVSSTGHLVVTSSLLGFDPEWREPFLIVVQLGAILAVVVNRWREIEAMIRGGRWLRFGILLFIGFLPAAVLGLLFHHRISELLKTPIYVAAAWIVGGVLILVIDRPTDKGHPAPVSDLVDITPKHALLIGLAQCLSLWPGMSRAACTILGGMVVGLNRPTATLFSFYLAIPTMVAASGYELVKNREHLSGAGLPILVGSVVAFGVAYATVKWLLGFVKTHTFRGFAAYRIAAGALLTLTPASWWAA